MFIRSLEFSHKTMLDKLYAKLYYATSTSCLTWRWTKYEVVVIPDIKIFRNLRGYSSGNHTWEPTKNVANAWDPKKFPEQ